LRNRLILGVRQGTSHLLEVRLASSGNLLGFPCHLSEVKSTRSFLGCGHFLYFLTLLAGLKQRATVLFGRKLVLAGLSCFKVENGFGAVLDLEQRGTVLILAALTEFCLWRGWSQDSAQGSLRIANHPQFRFAFELAIKRSLRKASKSQLLEVCLEQWLVIWLLLQRSESSTHYLVLVGPKS